jgi:hypothetical protein
MARPRPYRSDHGLTLSASVPICSDGNDSSVFASTFPEQRRAGTYRTRDFTTTELTEPRDLVSQTVFILGAGASYEAGAPLVSDFIARARALTSGRVRPALARGHSGAPHEEVFAAIRLLEKDSPAPGPDPTWNIESILTAFEAAELCGRLGDLPITTVAILPGGVRQLILTTLQNSILFPALPAPPGPPYVSEPRASPPPTYAAFGRLVADLSDALHQTVSILTFNYDICAEQACGHAGLPVDFGLSVPSPSERSVSILKLHGSLAWAHCPQCRKICEVTHFQFEHFPGDPTHLQLSIDHQLSHLSCCGGHSDFAPVIVPPTWNKSGHYELLRPVWKRAAAELADAENIIVMGYAYRDMDPAFGFLYALGTLGSTALRRFWVFDPAKNTEGERLRIRYERLLGSRAPTQLRIFSEQFSTAIDRIRSELHIPAR